MPLIVVAQLATGRRSMLTSLELLSLSIASALDEQNDVPCSMVKAQQSPCVRVVLPAKGDTGVGIALLGEQRRRLISVAVALPPRGDADGSRRYGDGG